MSLRSHTGQMVEFNALFTARRPDQAKHQPQFEQVQYVFRNGKRYRVEPRGRLVEVVHSLAWKHG